jgi:hypothetical protein
MEINDKQLKALRTELRRLKPDSPEWARRFGQVNKTGGTVIVEDAQRRASGLGRQQSRAARAIKASSGQMGIRIRLAGGSSVPTALAAFLGQNQRSGWYARRRYKHSAGRQFQPWVGNSWEPGGPGGPLAINPAIRANLDDVLDMWGDAVEDLMQDLNIN